MLLDSLAELSREAKATVPSVVMAVFSENLLIAGFLSKLVLLQRIAMLTGFPLFYHFSSGEASDILSMSFSERLKDKLSDFKPFNIYRYIPNILAIVSFFFFFLPRECDG